MTLLHDFYNLRNQQAFQRLLDGSERGSVNIGFSTSGEKSWNRSGTLTSATSLDVNARDWLGRTVLHLACTSLDSIEYVRLLLRHQHINVNLPDIESHWTPLHRAMYQANFPAALILLQRTDTDRSLQDFEGYTAFDLYNLTINLTRPELTESFAELYTWGVNRNATLGLGDGSDRTYPEQIVIRKKDEYTEGQESLRARFSPVLARQLQMSKLHTVVVTSESSGNLRVCGFGSGGRLGPGQHTQYSLKYLPQFNQTIVSVALGQDHTLALTKSGEVLSWGLNRFAQLGYVVESTPGEGFGRVEEPIQYIPKKIHGALRKISVKGVAASKGASACWTCSDVYTWGTNNGQLGYDKAAQPVQILPRKASKVTQPVLAISLNDSTMACLLETHDVICIWNDRQFKIIFPGHAFPPEIQPHRPLDAIQDAKVAKITSCEDTFAALSFNGELFTFSVPNITEGDGTPGKEKSSFKPQRVWALRKKFSAIKDVALGSDGSIIVCTESGHVFVRSRNTKTGQATSGKAFKFQRMPHLQRITQVCANSTGAFGALRIDYKPQPIEVHGNKIAQDMAEVQPYLSAPSTGSLGHIPRSPHSDTFLRQPFVKFDDETDDLYILNDIHKVQRLLDILAIQKRDRHKHQTSPDTVCLRYGADLVIYGPSETLFPAHRVFLGARSSVLSEILNGSVAIKDIASGISLRTLGKKDNGEGLTKLAIGGCHPVSILILLQYIYSDDLLAIWDGRISTALGGQLPKSKIQPAQVKLELHTLATLLGFPLLIQSLESPVKRIPLPSMEAAMKHLFETAQKYDLSNKTIFSPDVIIQLADKEVRCHSIVLRARSGFFADLFNENAWTVNRWDPNGRITINMRHLTWRIMDYVLRYMCCGADADIFDNLDSVASVDEVLEFVFDVMAAANELLLDRLVLICSKVILNHLSLNKACFILSDATFLHAEQLIERLQTYIIANMELFLMTGMLDDIPTHLIDHLAQFAMQKQAEKSPVSRSNCLALRAIAVHADWLALQDIPFPIPRTNIPSRKDSFQFKSSPGLSPLPLIPPNDSPPHQNPSPRPQRTIQRSHSSEDIFTMDDVIPASQSIPFPTKSTPRPPVWKAPSKPRVDMITVMAEAANSSSHHYPSGTMTRGAPFNVSKDTSKLQHNQRSSADSVTSPSGPGSARTLPTPNWRPIQDAGPRPLVTDTSFSHTPNISGKKESELMNLESSLKPRLRVPQIPPRSSGGLLGMGPVITPTRQSAPSTNPYASNIRRASGKAWNQPSVKPVATPASSSRMSILAIQQLELDQVASPGKEKRSLREIQEEEKSLQEEADFLTWWTAEEARVKLEIEAAAAATSHKGRGKQPRNRSGKKTVRSEGTSSFQADRSKHPPRKPS